MKLWAKAGLIAFGAVVLLFVVFIAVIWLGIGPENWRWRKARFERAAEKGMAVVKAIKAYESDHGSPPPTLEALIPNYLKRIPNTGLRKYPSYEYLVFTNSRASLVWYDLGSRHGKPKSGLWVYDDGDPEHAILALTLDQNEVVQEARVDRMPQNYDPMDFDQERWKRNESRIEMIRSLPKHISVKQRPFGEVKGILGEPNGRRMLRNSPWELRIDCPNGLLNWDIFFYWPTQDYPKSIYGGTTERIGQWAYVHE